MKINAVLQIDPGNLLTDDCQIERIVELSKEEFNNLISNPEKDHAFIAENKDCMYREDSGVMHCLLALTENSSDGVLIESEGQSYARLAAYVPGIRDIINAQMDRAVDFFVKYGTENTYSRIWYTYLDDFEDHSELPIRESSGMDKLLLEAFKRRREVADVKLTGDCIELNLHPEFCPSIAAYMKPDAAPQQTM